MGKVAAAPLPTVPRILTDEKSVVQAAPVGRRLFADAGGIGGATNCGRGIDKPGAEPLGFCWLIVFTVMEQMVHSKEHGEVQRDECMEVFALRCAGSHARCLLHRRLAVTGTAHHCHC